MKGKRWMIMALGVMLIFSGCSGREDGTSKSQKEDDKKTEQSSSSGRDEDGSKSSSSSGGETVGTDAMITTAEAFAADIIAGEYDKLSKDYQYVDTMKNALESGQIKQAMDPSIQASGTLKEIKKGFVSLEQGGYINVDVPCDFEGQPWNMTVTFTEDGKIAGIHVAEYAEGLAQAPEGVKETSLNLPIDNSRELPGTFTVPEGSDTYAAVVFVHGSGSSDRNEAAGSLKPFQDLAWGLAQKGIASYRYDKISYVYGQELARDRTFTVDGETVNDAAAAVRLVRGQTGVTKVFVVGHSQGAQMMGAIAQKGEPDGCVMMAAPAQGYLESFERQVKFLQGLNPNAGEEEKKVYEAYQEAIVQLKDLDAIKEDETVLGLYKNYWESILNYDAVENARKIQVPVLVLQGEEDYQVTMDDFKIWKDAFADDEKWQFQSFPGLTHMFMEGRYENGPADYQGVKHIPGEVVESIAAFIDKN